MGIFDFFKKKQQNQELSIYDIEDFIKNKKNEIKEKEKILVERLKENIKQLAIDLEEKIKILEKVDISEKKEHEKIKLIVSENLDYYMEHVKRLIKNLKEINTNNLNNLIISLDLIFHEFKKRSQINYEKATFLVGKEIGDIKDSIHNFTKQVSEIIEKNKEITDLSKIISEIEIKTNELNDSYKIEEENKKRLEKNNKDILELEDKKNRIETDFKKLKNSEQLKNILELEDSLPLEENRLNKEFFRLKDSIDFKQLSNRFHNDSRKMNIINEYKENFKESIIDYQGENLVRILKEADYNIEQIEKTIRDLIMGFNKLYSNKEKTRNSPEKSRLKFLDDSVEKVKDEIRLLSFENTKIIQKLDSFDEIRDEIIGRIGVELRKLNIIITQ